MIAGSNSDKTCIILLFLLLQSGKELLRLDRKNVPNLPLK